jgi:superoxide reductase
MGYRNYFSSGYYRKKRESRMKQNEIYTCSENEGPHDCCIIEVISDFSNCSHVPECCGSPMKLIEPKTIDQGREKHVPVIYPADGGYEVKVGDIAHPMLEKHYIIFIELRTPDATYRKYLKPDDEPVAYFPTGDEVIGAIAYCNIHGLWKS